MEPVEVAHGIVIPVDELSFQFARSSGPGGQHVNKVETRVTLRFDVRASLSLPPAAKARILAKLATRIDASGVLRVVSQASRSQAANRRAAIERFAALIRGALAPEIPRIETKVPARSRERRLATKRLRGRRKQERGAALDDES